MMIVEGFNCTMSLNALSENELNSIHELFHLLGAIFSQLYEFCLFVI